MNLINGRDSVIAGQDRIYTILTGPGHQMFIQPISIQNPVRNHKICVCPQSPQGTVQNVGGLDSINIIISNDPDPFLFFYFFSQNLRRQICIFQQMRIVQVCSRPMKIQIHFLQIGQTPVPHDPG